MLPRERHQLFAALPSSLCVDHRKKTRLQIEIKLRPLDPADGFAHLEVLQVLRPEEGKPVCQFLRIEVAQAEADARVRI